MKIDLMIIKPLKIKINSKIIKDLTNIYLMIIKPDLKKVQITNNMISSNTFINNSMICFCIFLDILRIFLMKIDSMIIKPNLKKVQIINSTIILNTFINNSMFRFCFFLDILHLFLVFDIYILDLLFFDFYLIWRIYWIIMSASNITKEDVTIDPKKMQVRFDCTLLDWFQYGLYCYCWSYGGIFQLHSYLRCTAVIFPSSCFYFCYSCRCHACENWWCFHCLRWCCCFQFLLRNLQLRLRLRLRLQ